VKDQRQEAHVGVGLQDHPNGIACGQAATREVMATIDPARPIQLALLFTSHPEPTQVLKGVHEVLDAEVGAVPLIGSVTAGEYSHTGYTEGGAGVMLIQSESLRLHPLVYRQHWLRRGRKLLGNLQGITEDGLRNAYHHRALMLFPDNQSMNLDLVVERAMSETAMLYDILGGAGLVTSRKSSVFYQQRSIQSGLAGVELLSQHALGMALANGWTPLSGPYRVTQADSKHLTALDGRPVLEIYEDIAAEQSPPSAVTDAVTDDFLLRHPIGVCEGDTCKVSVAAMGFDGRGALKLTAPPPVNSLVSILTAQPEAMILAAERSIEQARGVLSQPAIAGALFIDCMSTGLVLQESHEQQRQAVQAALGDTPFLGIRSHGVLARLQGQISGCHECSVATCLIPA
jgi:hypothetical protein